MGRSRKKISTKVRQLRLARSLTQNELAKRLHISQNRLSEIERGGGSFTAEQFLELLRLFNVTASDFVEDASDPSLELQNALARLGATHLHESAIVASAVLEEVHDVVREALLNGSPRLITALAPVLALHADTLNLPKLYAELHELGLERRLAWAVENTLDALDALANESGSGAKGWSKLKRRAEVPFRLFMDLIGPRGEVLGWKGAPDPLDPTIRSLRTLEDVKRAASKPSERWGIATSIQPGDFVQALRASRATG
ncbi:MAG: helix-turn-helix transcriptional regulator [Kofleriaceae bacterium]